MHIVSVDLKILVEVRKKCFSAIKEINDTVLLLKNELSLILTSWEDKKAREFEEIVKQCVTSLEKPLNDLQRCNLYLQRLENSLEEYDNISFLGVSNMINNLSETIESSSMGNIINYTSNRNAIQTSVSNASQSSPRSLLQTQYDYEPMMINGQQYMMYNKPIDTARYLIINQGQNSRNMFGTCGLCQCVNMLRMAGVRDVTEDDVINVALSCSDNVVECLEVDNPDPDERGGTTVAGRCEILSRYNLQMDEYRISMDRNVAVSQLAQYISSGHGVIVSADAGILWNDTRYLGGGHAISLLSVSDTGDRFIYSDTGTGRIGVISANRLGQALTGRPANVTRNIIR